MIIVSYFQDMTQQVIVTSQPNVKETHMQLSMTHITPIYIKDTDLEKDIGAVLQLAVFNLDQALALTTVAKKWKAWKVLIIEGLKDHFLS